MKRPKIIRPTKLTMALPEDVRAKLDLHLFSQVEGRVPMGAYQRFFIERIKEFFNPAPAQQFSKLDRSILSTVLAAGLQDFPQEWWTEHFIDPQEAYLAAHELLKVLK